MSYDYVDTPRVNSIPGPLRAMRVINSNATAVRVVSFISFPAPFYACFLSRFSAHRTAIVK